MPNVQQPEMRRNEHNPLVQDSREPGPNGRPGGRGGRGRSRPMPREQVSPYGPPGRPVRTDRSG
ncbi:hypothetical protein [Plantactinospora sp. KBS50]|uniref:hypothetical protein n=1 Tax=Plantactinospora sp. KBS50 TaxID=2024580 RepID=UPI000BAB1866|nr:hypothetical protein [Plantactinospora sp. KBS50]ASW55125.1 hypothetical protein CIK06_14505 [Plantactinospora sp. KBS50]